MTTSGVKTNMELSDVNSQEMPLCGTGFQLHQKKQKCCQTNMATSLYEKAQGTSAPPEAS